MTVPGPVPEVPRDAALRRVLARHHLLDQSGAAGVARVADDLVGLHSTSPRTPYLSLHQRIRGFAATDLDDALYQSHDLVRLKAMRGTVFAFTPRLAPLAFAATRAATVASDRRWLKTNDQTYNRLAPRVLATLAGHGSGRQGLSVAELRKSLGHAGLPEGRAGELSAVVGLLCDQGQVVRDRPVGGRTSTTFRYRLWTDAFPEVNLAEWDEAAATRELVRRYLDGYGPVSRNDLLWWSGLPARRIDAALETLGEDLRAVSVPGLGDRLLITREALEATLPVEPGPRAVSLLPMLDPYPMGYQDRTRLLDPALNDTVIDRSGNVTSVVLINGRVEGVWDLTEKPTPTIRVLLFDPDHRARGTVLDRAAQIAGFWFDRPVPIREYLSMVPLKRRTGVMRRPLDDAQPKPAVPPNTTTQPPATGP